MAGSGIPVNGTACASCPAGYYGDSSLSDVTSLAVCRACPIGTFTEGESTGASVCKTCPSLTYTTLIGTSGACPSTCTSPGTLNCSPSTGEVLTCQSGFERLQNAEDANGQSLVSCAPCLPGSFGDGLSNCATCKPGTYSTSSAGVCTSLLGKVDNKFYTGIVNTGATAALLCKLVNYQDRTCDPVSGVIASW